MPRPSVERKINALIRLCERDWPIPVDLQAFLISNGIDVAAIEAKHRP